MAREIDPLGGAQGLVALVTGLGGGGRLIQVRQLLGGDPGQTSLITAMGSFAGLLHVLKVLDSGAEL